ncbi:unannotated protein [freshwater metagenome]|uniref:Unannotated protein n=1 Tax=freshwater metagenome TaxID=449393 RepID=A0A6J6B6P8_9ZZZZ
MDVLVGFLCDQCSGFDCRGDAIKPGEHVEEFGIRQKVSLRERTSVSPRPGDVVESESPIEMGRFRQPNQFRRRTARKASSPQGTLVRRHWSILRLLRLRRREEEVQ